MALQQSAAMLQLISFINEIRMDKEVMAFLQAAKDVEVLQYRSDMLSAKPMLQLLGQVLEVGDQAYDAGFPAECARLLSIEKLKSIVTRAEALATPAAVMSNMGAAFLVNPVALAMFAHEGISVSILHECEDYRDEQDCYVPAVRYVTKHFVL